MYILNKSETIIINLSSVKKISVEYILDSYFIVADDEVIVKADSDENAKDILWDILQSMEKGHRTYHFIY